MKKICPHCKSDSLNKYGFRLTKNSGNIQRYRCNNCNKTFTHRTKTIMDKLKTHCDKVGAALHARTEGVGVRATGRLVGVSHSTIIRWEIRVQRLNERLEKRVLPMVDTPIIENDEIYTKVKKNRPASESSGWTLIGIERKSRYWTHVSVGKRKMSLFKSGVNKGWRRIKRGSIWISDGERRYSQALEDTHGTKCFHREGNKNRNRLDSTWIKDLIIVRKVKGSQNIDRKRRKRYERVGNWHPETLDIDDSEIHINHSEAWNAALRRRSSAYRRRSNHYAKSIKGLNRATSVQQLFSNYVRPHPALRKGEVPAQVAGFIKERWTIMNILEIC